MRNTSSRDQGRSFAEDIFNLTAGSKEFHSFLCFAQEPYFTGRKTHYEFSKTSHVARTIFELSGMIDPAKSSMKWDTTRKFTEVWQYELLLNLPTDLSSVALAKLEARAIGSSDLPFFHRPHSTYERKGSIWSLDQVP